MFVFYPEKLWSREEVMSSPSPVPAVSGLYFWLFKTVPSGVPLNDCVAINGHTLLYVGISPDKKGKPNSRANLKTRIKTHYSGNIGANPPKGQPSAEHLVFYSPQRANSLCDVLVQEKGLRLPTPVSNGLMNGWQITQRFTGYHMMSRGFWKKALFPVFHYH